LSPALGRLLTETTTLNRNEYAHLLDLREGYRVSELTVSEDGWLTHESLRDLRPADEGVVVLGITHQDGLYASPPDPDTLLSPGDVLTVYGHQDRLRELSTRSDNDETAHERAIEEHAQNSEEAEFPSHS
ncbi:MAG TPA: TrkA C-terminal domain-containing protein, partial [Halococcus sp.]|nr:TrkA C-terminal domain-containing protein [Halococcus sp.]